jgi:hypothetical protein
MLTAGQWRWLHCGTRTVLMVFSGQVRPIWAQRHYFLETQLGEISSSHVASMKLTVFWDVASCILVEVYRHFRGAHCAHHKGALIMETVVPLKRRSVSIRLYGASSQKTVTFRMNLASKHRCRSYMVPTVGQVSCLFKWDCCPFVNVCLLSMATSSKKNKVAEEMQVSEENWTLKCFFVEFK